MKINFTILKTILGCVVVIITTVLFTRIGWLQPLLAHLVSLRGFSELLAGMLYTSVVTTPLALVLLGVLSEYSHPIFIAVVGGAGALVTDFFLLHLFSRAGRVIRITRPRPLVCTVAPYCVPQLLGVLVLALPLPDELAMALFGVNHIKLWQFVLLVYPVKVMAIFLLTVGAH